MSRYYGRFQKLMALLFDPAEPWRESELISPDQAKMLRFIKTNVDIQIAELKRRSSGATMTDWMLWQDEMDEADA